MLAMTLAVLALQGAPAKQQEPTLKALCAVAQRLDDGIKAFIGGKDMKESFKSWDAGGTSEEVVTKLREDFAQNHVAAAKTVAVEIGLVLCSDGKPVFKASAMLHVTPTEALLIGIRARKDPPQGKSGVPSEKCAKDAQAFAEAGAALLKILKTKKADELPFADGDKVAQLMPKAYEEELKKAIEKTKAEADDLRAKLNDLKYDEVRIDLDEVLFTPFGSEGLSKDGTIRCKLRITEAGDVTFRLHGYVTK
ncbi:MAG TPA: hypothetical protein VFC90_02395 [Planctomycetota bacterium]|nr:hypothetical protein [Planctomycetota bacterium]